MVPLINREIPVILDDYVDMEFGTGCLKVTPAHDPNDFDLGQKHNLETVNIMNPDGSMSEAAQLYIGEDRFDVRKKIEKELDSEGHLVKVEDYDNKVGYSERTDVIIEPRLSLQWWVDMPTLAKPALDAVMNEDVKFHPKKFVNTYKHWMGNIKDWCISRQLWWGHRIPAFYFGEGDDDYVVAKTPEIALEMAREKSGNASLQASDLKQDEDVMDTWFSSWLWPISVFDGLFTEKEVSYYYPTNDLVTAPDIIFFWVARMIMAGYEYRNEKPFQNVYFTGIVRDKLGRKMSKSLGNSPDPLELIQEYGADGVRVGLLLTAPAGNDLPFDPKLCEQGRNFSNKIWNAFRLIRGWEVVDQEPREAAKVAMEWISSRLSQTVSEINHSFDRFRISEALMTTYKLIWDDFCSWYLEMIKPPYGEPIDQKTLDFTLDLFEDMLRLLHPFMPFISEELWQVMRDRTPEQALVIADWPKVSDIDEKVLERFNYTVQVVSGIRNVRKENNIPNKIKLNLSIKENNPKFKAHESVLKHLCQIEQIEYVDEKVPNAFSILQESNEYFIPFGDNVDQEAEKEKIEKELEYAKGFLNSVEKKLSNERFVSGAPEQVVASEKKKQQDTLEKIKILEDKLASLN